MGSIYKDVLTCFDMKNRPKKGTYSRDYKNSSAYLRGVIPNIPRGKTKKKKWYTKVL